MVRLTVKTDQHSQVFETEEAVITIGRASANTLRISDDQSSRQHCRIERAEDGSYTLTDLASRNGTYLNNLLVDEHPLKPGDIVRIGTTSITFELPSAGQAAQGAAEAQAPPQPEAPQAIKLVFVDGPLKGKSQVIYQKLTTLGRQRRNDIMLDDGRTSNRHAEIRRGPDGFVLVDAGSMNGTFLNGRLILRNPLAPGDEVRIGKSIIQVQAATVDAEAAAQAATVVADRGEAAEEAAAFEMGDEEAAGASAWKYVALPLVAVVVLAAAATFYFRRDIEAWIYVRGQSRTPDLLARRGGFDSSDARQAWKAEPNTTGRFTGGHLEVLLPSRGAAGGFAAYGLAEPVPIARARGYVVSARIHTERLTGGFAGIAATWVGRENWEPHADVLLRPQSGPDPWLAVKETLTPPPWAEFLQLSCIATGNSGTAAFDDVAVVDTPEQASLPRLVADPLALVMDTPVLFSLSHKETLLAAGAGVVVDLGQKAAAVRQPRAEAGKGYPKIVAGRYECQTSAALPQADTELFVHHVVTYEQNALRLEYRLWTKRELGVGFAGLELPGPAAALRSGLDVRTPSGFFQQSKEEGSFSFDDVHGLTWNLERGKLFLASEAPFTVECRIEGARALYRVGERGAKLGPKPLVIALTLRGTMPAEEQRIVAELAEAERAAREKRYGEAIKRYEQAAQRYADRRAESEVARKELQRLRREAIDQARTALRLVERAELTGEPGDFDEARTALEPLLGALKGTSHEAEIAQALQRCQTQRAATEQRRREGEAESLLRVALDSQKRQEPHIAGLQCRELLARFPKSAAAAQAQALLETLSRPAPPPSPAPAPAPEPVPAPKK